MNRVWIPSLTLGFGLVAAIPLLMPDPVSAQTLPATVQAQASPKPMLSPQPRLSPSPAASTPTPVSSPASSILPVGSEVVTPPAPPSFQVPVGQASPTPTITPAIPRSANDLTVPQNPLQVRVQTTQGLTLKQALDLGVQQNPQVRQAQLAIQSAQAGIDQARAAYAPIFSGSANYAYSQPPSAGSAGIRRDSSSLSASLLRLDYTFLDAGGGRDIRLQIAQEQLTLATLQLAQTSQTVKLSVAEAYYDLQNADAQVLINQGAVENSRANLKDAEAQERAGLGTRFDVLRAQTELANNLQALLRSQNDQQVSRRKLAQILNFSTPTDLTASDPIRVTSSWNRSLEDSIVAAYQSRQELEIQRRTLEQSRERAKNALATNQPSVSVFATADAGKNFQANEEVSFGYSVGANLRVTYSDGGLADAQARGFEITALTAASQFDQARNDIRQAVESSFLTLLSNRDQIDSSKAAVASAEESLRLARLRFQAGVGTQTEVISAESALTTARGNLSRAIIGYNRALAELQRSVNEL